MRKRTQAREFALQMLYQLDIHKCDLQEALELFWSVKDASREVRDFTQQLVEGTLREIVHIDAFIVQHADNWDLKRMAVVDRNILRLGVFELTYTKDVPPSVCINEAIELAKRFGDADSAKFINGILDAVHKANVKP